MYLISEMCAWDCFKYKSLIRSIFLLIQFFYYIRYCDQVKEIRVGVVVILYQFLKENPCMNPSAREGGGCRAISEKCPLSFFEPYCLKIKVRRRGCCHLHYLCRSVLVWTKCSGKGGVYTVSLLELKCSPCPWKNLN